jgi:hypothetical protein
MELIKVLAEYLGAKEEALKEIDTNLFENQDTEIQYFVIKCDNVHRFIQNEVFTDEYEDAIRMLHNRTCGDIYAGCFIVDEDALEDYCLENLEEILCTQPRESFSFENEDYIILEVDG